MANSPRELLEITIFGMEQDREELPEPSPLSSIHTEENERSVLVDVYMPSIRMAGKNRSVNRTVTLPAWMNAAAQERNVNFSQVLHNALREYLEQ